MKAYVFPGQGSQFPGMGKEHYDENAFARRFFEHANDILGFKISDVMFNGSEEDLKQTNVTQPAIFLHSVIAYKMIDGANPHMVAGHSLGEFTALVVNGTLTFEDGLALVRVRATAMQKACEVQPTTMAAVLALADQESENICASIQQETGEIVVPANFNCPGQLVISGSIAGIDLACERMKAAGAKRAIKLPVGGAFHSPFMEPAKEELAKAIRSTTFHKPSCPVYQNVVARPVKDPEEIQQNLIDQLTGPVKWTQTIENMINDGANSFTEVGPGKVLQGLIAKINKSIPVESIN
ncbi:MAG: ACP S-malonyltransferase [Bacteroidetes bacterium]|nr:ACP S-malonyltransferase [Bacteroidota bacterium]